MRPSFSQRGQGPHPGPGVTRGTSVPGGGSCARVAVPTARPATNVKNPGIKMRRISLFLLSTNPYLLIQFCALRGVRYSRQLGVCAFLYDRQKAIQVILAHEGMRIPRFAVLQKMDLFQGIVI